MQTVLRKTATKTKGKAVAKKTGKKTKGNLDAILKAADEARRKGIENYARR